MVTELEIRRTCEASPLSVSVGRYHVIANIGGPLLGFLSNYESADSLTFRKPDCDVRGFPNKSGNCAQNGNG